MWSKRVPKALTNAHKVNHLVKFRELYEHTESDSNFLDNEWL